MLTAHAGQYWILFKSENRDALYGDPLYGGAEASGRGVAYSYRGPYDLEFAIIYQERDNKNWNVMEQGVVREYDAECWISRNEWERMIGEAGIDDREPEEGDVIYGMGQWWDVSKADRGGYIVDQDNWVGYRIELKKTTADKARRKVGIT